MVKNRLITDLNIVKVLFSTIIGSHALINNSYLLLISSIILAPLGRLFIEMYPNTNFYSEAVLVLLGILIISTIYSYKKFKNVNNQMKIRTSLKCLMQTVFISIMCFIGIKNKLLLKESATIITIAISCVLLLPLINIGLNLGIYLKNSNHYNSLKQHLLINGIILLINLGILFYVRF
jgi:hypothetical protein